jgi:hypothetical protein
MPDYLLGSLELMWWVPKMVLGATFDSYGFTWLLSLPTCGGGCGWASLLPALSWGLRPLDEGSELLGRRCLIPLYCSEQRRLSRGCDAPSLDF